MLAGREGLTRASDDVEPGHPKPESDRSSATPPQSDRRIEIALVSVLSVAGLLTSWCSFQSALWSSRQQIAFDEANDLRVEAANVQGRADLRRTVDLEVFQAWLAAELAGDEGLAAFYRARFPPNLAAAFDDWMAERPFENPDAPSTPLAEPSYRVDQDESAAALKAQAVEARELGVEANQTADAYDRAVAIVAMSMFLAGICQAFRGRSVRIALTLLAALSCGLGAAMSLALPVLRL